MIRPISGVSTAPRWKSAMICRNRSASSSAGSFRGSGARWPPITESTTARQNAALDP